MKKYTIGILFNEALDKVVLIEKQRPEWQKGLLNFPGGHIEEGENEFDCVAREFNEECGIQLAPNTWSHIGRINNEGNYFVEVFTNVAEKGTFVISITDESCDWFGVKTLPPNVISNIKWLLEFALNYHKQGNADSLHFGTFEYMF